MEKKQSAVDWLVDQMFKQGYFDGNKPLSITNLDHLQHQANEIEKKRIIDIVEKSRQTGLTAEYLLLTYDK